MDLKAMNLSSMSEADARRLPPLTLAYIGDAVYEVYIRTLLVRDETMVHRLHARCVKWVSAVGQEKVWEAIQEYLTEDEASIARQGRNAKGNVPHNVEPATYRRSTSLEAVLGYLYLAGREERILALLEKAFQLIEPTIISENERRV